MPRRLPRDVTFKDGGRGKRFVLIASQFHPPISRALVHGAVDVLRRAGAASSAIDLLWVPGAFELSVVAARVAHRQPRPHAIIALGALIRGQTAQYEVLAHAVAQGLSQVSVTERIPVSFGLIVADTMAQAKARAGLPAPRSARRSHGRHRGKARQAGGSMGNRGAEAALAALAVLRLFDRAGIRYHS
jgi:6,7-dimethyl-8-ribityllumazine synthase